jgi:hypothetical protein
LHQQLQKEPGQIDNVDLRDQLWRAQCDVQENGLLG